MKLIEALKIVSIALKVNGIHRRAKETTGTLPTVFVSFYGHVAYIEIHVFKDGWESFASYDREFVFYTKNPLDEKEFQEYRRYMYSLLGKKS